LNSKNCLRPGETRFPTAALFWFLLRGVGAPRVESRDAGLPESLGAAIITRF